MRLAASTPNSKPVPESIRDRLAAISRMICGRSSNGSASHAAPGRPSPIPSSSSLKTPS